MPSLNRNERTACLECGREYTRKDASRHRKHCVVLKCSYCNFYTYSSEELTDHTKKKHCQHNVKLCGQQSQNTLQEKIKLICFFLNKNKVENFLINIFLLNLKSLYTIFEKFLVKNSQFFVIILVLSFSKVLIDDKTSNNRVQIVLKLSIETDPKIFSLL